jgi:catechol 2,3-dioxygenase-like lactoylglutathione lyase family enzyme
VELDHLILGVNDREESIAFYTGVLGLTQEADDGPFAVIRVTSNFILLLAPFGTNGGEHLAFAMSRDEFDAVFEHIRASGIEYGDSFDAVGNMRGPGVEFGAHGMQDAIYILDPNKHLIEIRA